MGADPGAEERRAAEARESSAEPTEAASALEAVEPSTEAVEPVARKSVDVSFRALAATLIMLERAVRAA